MGTKNKSKKDNQKTAQNPTQRHIIVYKTCNPKCMFFPNREVVSWEYGEDNLKHRIQKEKDNFKCGYSGELIKNWDSQCPFYTEVQEYQNSKK